MANTPPLHLAVVYNNVELVEVLLKQNLDVDEVFEGQTPLHRAMYERNEEIIRLLLKAGANVDIRNNYGEIALHFSTGKTVQLLLDHGSNVHAIEQNQSTPLHHASEFTEVKVIKCLLKHGANINALDSDGRTPVMRVLGKPDRHYEHPNPFEVLPFLLEYSDVNVIDREGNNILNSEPNIELSLHIVVKHLAKLKILNLFIHQSILNTISNSISLSTFFESCILELQKAKNTKFDNSWVSFFNLLTDDKSKLRKYAGNQNILKGFKKNMSKKKKEFPIYGDEISKNFSKAIVNRKIWDNTAMTLSYNIPIFDQFHLIIKNILEQLSIKDILKLTIS